MPRRKRAGRALREYALHALLLAALIVPVFPGVFFRGEVAFPANYIYMQEPWRTHMPGNLVPQSAYTETLSQSNAWYYLTSSAMRDGEWPLWNPYQFLGVSLIGAYQTAIFYPPRLLFLLLDDLYVAFTVFILFKLWLAGMLAYLCGRGLSLAPAYARFFSIAYMLGGYMVIPCCYPTADSMAWAPIFVLGLELLLGGRWQRGYAACLIAVTMMLFAAGAQHTLTFLFLAGIYLLVRLLGRNERKYALRAMAAAAAAGITAILVTSIQVLPFIQTLGESLPVLDTYFSENALDYFLSPMDVPVLWAPHYFGTYLHANFWGRMNAIYVMLPYIGVPCWLAASLALRRNDDDHPHRAQIRCLIILALVAAWLAFNLPGSTSVYALPLFKTVRPIYFMTFFIFAVPLAAAFALQRWYSEPVRPARLWPAFALSVIIVSITLLHALANASNLATLDRIMEQNGTLVESIAIAGKPGVPVQPMDGSLSEFVWSQVYWTFKILALSLAALALTLIPRYRRYGIHAVTAVLALDLLCAWYGLQPTSPREHVFPDVAVFDEIQKHGHPYRVSVSTAGIYAMQIAYGIEETHGYDTVIPKRFWDVVVNGLSPAGMAALEPALATPCYLFPAPNIRTPTVTDGFEIKDVREGLIVAENTRALPRARLVGNVERYNSLGAMLKRINQPGFDPSNLALVEGPDAPAANATPDSQPGAAQITHWSWNDVNVEFDADADSVLVLSEAYYPGWEARLDSNTNLPIFPVYHLLRGVQVPAGHHTVAFTFRPFSFRLGAALSVSTLVVLLGAAAAMLYRQSISRKRSQCVPAR